MNKISQVRISSPLISGMIYAFLIMGGAALLISFLLLLSGMKEQSLSLYSFVIHGIALFIGGFMSGKRASNKGWYHGGLLGLVYSLIVIFVAFLGFDSALSFHTLLFVALAFAVGAFGGAIGVNISK